jgi:hypothetical protein
MAIYARVDAGVPSRQSQFSFGTGSVSVEMRRLILGGVSFRVSGDCGSRPSASMDFCRGIDDDLSMLKALGRLLSSVGLIAEKFSDPVAFLARLKTGHVSCRNPRRMDAPDERFGSAGPPPTRLAEDAHYFHHRTRRSVSAPDRDRCGSFRLSRETFRRRDSCAARA